MKKLKGCLGVFLIFFFGVIVGVAVTAGVIHEQVQAVIEGGPDKVVDVVVERLKKELKLDGSQQLRLQQIVADTRIRLRQINEQTQPQMHAALAEAEGKVRGILYAAQVKKFDTIVRQGREKWKAGDGTPEPMQTAEPAPANPAMEGAGALPGAAPPAEDDSAHAPARP